ncbi:SPW repeat domain-containing protein [Sphaerisporangium perillae]|uniref:SPW repeat domain-containing protein n=1 Tax=Sphaerisporangium perillae TaxID=2935860 RepID=UPI00200DC500|nr:SPW repeat protein [Sphaerisporangium perillae]
MDLTKSWADVVAFLAGAAAVLAPFFWASAASDATQPLLLLGALLLVSALWSLLGAGGASSWVTAAFGALLVVSPWAFGFDGSAAAAWTAWIAGAVTVIVGLWTATQTRSRVLTNA